MSQTNDEIVPICDYEGSDYQTRFWENQGREYEDLVERIAIRHLLPPRGKRLLEIGTGFGRLVDMYQGYDEIILLDYSKSLLRQAQQRLGSHPRYTFIAASVYQLPLADGQVDAVSMIRVIHHLADVPKALSQIERVLRPQGTLLLEFASKLHLKSLLRHAMGQQNWSPFDPNPVEFVSLNFDFHPRWMCQQLQMHGFEIKSVRTLSHFRLPALKKVIPARLLAMLDALLQPTGKWWPCAPSVMIRAQCKKGRGSDIPDRLLGFQCPACQGNKWNCLETERLCLNCGRRWRIDEGIHDFKTPL